MESIMEWSVLPVVALPAPGHGVLGTAFRVRGAPGFALTAQHVIKQAASLGEVGTLALMLSYEGQWRPLLVEEWEAHPTEDVALLRLLEGDTPAPTPVFGASDARLPVSTTYSVLGYPDDDYWSGDEEGKVQLDLSYSEGHVRRHRRAGPLPGMRGTRFVELSCPAGSGCSGAPIFVRQASGAEAMPVAAVYVGERRPEGSGNAVGYGVPFSEIADWEPKLLRRSLFA